ARRAIFRATRARARHSELGRAAREPRAGDGEARKKTRRRSDRRTRPRQKPDPLLARPFLGRAFTPRGGKFCGGRGDAGSSRGRLGLRGKAPASLSREMSRGLVLRNRSRAAHSETLSPQGRISPRAAILIDALLTHSQQRPGSARIGSPAVSHRRRNFPDRASVRTLLSAPAIRD